MSVTPTGRTRCTRRLSAATSLDDIETVWACFGASYQQDAEVYAHYLTRKKGFM